MEVPNHVDIWGLFLCDQREGAKTTTKYYAKIPTPKIRYGVPLVYGIYQEGETAFSHLNHNYAQRD
jgi:hypothetical protein